MDVGRRRPKASPALCESKGIRIFRAMGTSELPKSTLFEMMASSSASDMFGDVTASSDAEFRGCLTSDCRYRRSLEFTAL